MRRFTILALVTVLTSMLISPSVCFAAVTDRREATIASIRADLAEAGRRTIELKEAHVPYGRDDWGYVESIYTKLRHERPAERLNEALDRAIRTGSREERIGALSVYQDAVAMHDRPADPAYEPILLRIIGEEDFWLKAYSDVVVVTLIEVYPSREALFAIMDAVGRAPSLPDRIGLTYSAARLCHIELPYNINEESTGPRVEKILADFAHWFAENKDRIRFTKKGEFRLSGAKLKFKQPELTEADRKLIRQDPGCVVQLMNGASGGNDDLGAVRELHSRCGAALFGTEGSEAMAKALSEGSGGDELSVSTQATLSSLAGTYPVADAWILAAAYVVANGTDAATMELAKDALVEVSPAEVKRIGKGEPRDVVRKAQSLANDSRGELGD